MILIHHVSIYVNNEAAASATLMAPSNPSGLTLDIKVNFRLKLDYECDKRRY